MFEGWKVVPYHHQRGKEGKEYIRVVVVDLFPDKVGDLVGAWG